MIIVAQLLHWLPYILEIDFMIFLMLMILLIKVLSGCSTPVKGEVEARISLYFIFRLVTYYIKAMVFR